MGSAEGASPWSLCGPCPDLGEDVAAGVEDVQGLVAQVLVHGGFEHLGHLRGLGAVADEGGHRHQVGVALVEGAAYPVGHGVGAFALVVHHLLGHDDGVARPVEQQQERARPDEQQDPGDREERAGAEAAAGRGGGPRALAEQLAAQAFQRGADPGGLAAPGHGDGPGEVAAGEPAALQEQPDQGTLHGAEEQRDGEPADEQQGGRGGQTEDRARGDGGILGDLDHRDDGQAEAGGDGGLAGLRRGECGVAGDGALAHVAVAAEAAADAQEPAGSGLLGLDGVLLRLAGGGLREGLQLPVGLLDLVALQVGEDLLGLGDAVAAEEGAGLVDDSDGAELSEADTRELQAVGGDEELLRPALPVQQGEGEQPGLAVLETHHARGEAVLVGELGPVDRRQRHVLAARGEEFAGLDLDDGGARPLLVDVADLVEDRVGGHRVAGAEQLRRPREVGDALVDGGAQRDGAVLGEVLLGGAYGFGDAVVSDAAECEGGDARQGEEQNRQHGDGWANATQQGHIGSSADLVPPLRRRSGQRRAPLWNMWGVQGARKSLRGPWGLHAPERTAVRSRNI